MRAELSSVGSDEISNHEGQLVEWIQEAPTVKSLLTAKQLRNAGPYITMYLDPKYLRTIRSSSMAQMSFAMQQALNSGGGPSGMFISISR